MKSGHSICHRTVNRGSVKLAQVQLMPMIDIPFYVVAIYLIGTLSPITDRRN